MSNAKPIEIFRGGSHVDNMGRRMTFSRADVDAIANAYDPASFAAPLVVGHPKTNDPAFGWVKSLKVRDDGVLIAEPEKVEPQFAEAVRAGRYRKVSASFYLPDHPANPAPGQYYLRHVGFLGAAAPAVKGLSPVEFNEQEEKVVTLVMSRRSPAAEFSDPEEDGFDKKLGVARLLSVIADFVGGENRAGRELDFMEQEKLQEGKNTGPAVRARLRELTGLGMSLEDISKALSAMGEQAARSAGTLGAILHEQIANPPDSLIGFLNRVKPPEKTTENAEPGRDGGQIKKETALSDAEKTRLAALEAENAALKKANASFAEQTAAARKKEDADFVASLVKDGKLAPAMAAGVTSFMQSLDGEKTVSFSEGGDKTPRAFFRDLLAGAGKVIDFAERSAGDGKEEAKPQPLEARMAAQFKTGKE